MALLTWTYARIETITTWEKHPTREQNLQNNPRKKRQRSRAQFIWKIILGTYVFCCCWSWQYMHRPVNLQISTCQNGMLLLQICISYWSFLILCCWSKLISWMLINRPHPMNGHILAKTVLNQRKKLTVAIEMKKSCCVMGLWVDRRDLGHQQNGQRTWF